ncbi:hypothetical protein Tco_0808796 [Tanacetum coccineum]
MANTRRFETYVKSKDIDICRNHVRKFLRALPTKWRPKVTVIEEPKDLSTLPLDELIYNLKVYEVVLEKYPEASKNKKEKYNSLALKAKKVSSDEEVSCFGSDEEYAMAIRDFKKFFRRGEKFVQQPHDDKKNLQRAKEEKKGKEERRCFKCGDPNHFIIESLSLKLAKFENSSYFLQEMIEKQRPKKDKKVFGFTEDRASTSEAKPGKLVQESGNLSTVEPAKPVPSAREPPSSDVGNQPSTELCENLDSNVIKRTSSVQITKKSLPNGIVENVKQTPALKLGQGLGRSKI